MVAQVDLGPATGRLADLLAGIPDDALDRPTPCPAYRLGDLVEHVGGLAVAFTRAARKDVDDGPSEARPGDASRLGPDWRTRIPRDLDALAAAWRDADAWTGMTEAGGVALPGEVAGLVALDEVVIHGWDVARASGQPFSCEPGLLAVLLGFLTEATASTDEPPPEGLFGPPVPVTDGAPLLDRVVALTGRRPGWSPG
jgi:uncharacterized protein (TIGR03086 family)